MSRVFKVGSASVEVGTEQYRTFKRTVDRALPTAARRIRRVTRQIKTSAMRGGLRRARPVSGIRKRRAEGYWPIGRPRPPGPGRRYSVANSKRQLFTEERFSPPFTFEGIVGNSAPYAWSIRRPFPRNHQRVAHYLLVKPFRKHAPLIAAAIAKDLAGVG